VETVENPVKSCIRATIPTVRLGENHFTCSRFSDLFCFPQVIHDLSPETPVENPVGYQKLVYTVGKKPLASKQFLCYASETSEDSPNNDHKLIYEGDALSRKKTSVQHEGGK